MVEFIRNLFLPEKRARYSIAAKLDDDTTQFIKDIWAELENELGITHPYANPVPHITHVQAHGIKTPDIYDTLERFRELQEPYVVRTSGLGIFTGKHIAIYISVVRNPQLTAIQTTLLATLAGSLENIRETHLVNYWMPHISLLVPTMIDDRLGDVVTHLATRDFSREFTVSELVILDSSDTSGDNPHTISLTKN